MHRSGDDRTIVGLGGKHGREGKPSVDSSEGTSVDSSSIRVAANPWSRSLGSGMANLPGEETIRKLDRSSRMFERLSPILPTPSRQLQDDQPRGDPGQSRSSRFRETSDGRRRRQRAQRPVRAQPRGEHQHGRRLGRERSRAGRDSEQGQRAVKAGVEIGIDRDR